MRVAAGRYKGGAIVCNHGHSCARSGGMSMWIPFVIFAVVDAVLVWRERMARRYKAQLLQSALTA